MKNKKQKSIGKTVAIIILVVLLVCSLGYIAYDKILSKSLNKDKNEIDEKSNKVENLDVNSRLVQNLYSKVSTGEMSKEDADCYFNYMYDISTDEGNKISDFYANQADEKQKMRILGRLLSSSEERGIYYGEESLIPDEIPGEGHKSILAINRDYPGMQYLLEYRKIDTQYYYEKSYIDMLYKELYGKNAKLNTSVPISIDQYNISLYYYVPAVDKYLLYMIEGGGTCGPLGDYGTIVKATKNDNEIKIYEKVTEVATGDFDTEESGKSVSYKDGDILGYTNFVYTFEIEDDGMYKYISRVKES